MLDFVVVGGGISGLSLTWYLSRLRSDWSFRLLEAGARMGGIIGNTREEGFLLEHGPESFINRVPEILELVQELGLENELIQADEGAKRRFLYTKRGLKTLPSGPGSLLTTASLPLGARFRLMREPWIRASPPEQDETVSQFMERRLGPVARDLYVDAFVSGIFAGDPANLSIQAAFPRLVEWERTHGSIVRGAIKAMKARRADARLNRIMPAGAMLSFKNGMGTLPKRLVERLPPERLTTQFSAQKIEKVTGGWEVHGESERVLARRVILCVPSFRAADLLVDLAPEVSTMTRSIPYAGIAVTGLGFHRDQIKHPLNGFGFLCPDVTKSPILGCLFSSSIFPGHRAPKDHVLLRVMAGGYRHPERVRAANDERVSNALAAVRSLLKIQGDPVFTRGWNRARAIPQYQLGHTSLVDDLENRLTQNHPKLWLSGQAYRGLGVIDCVGQSKILAEKIASTTAP